MIRWFKPFVFLSCLGPLMRLGWKVQAGRLGANPIEVITHSTGDWILIFLLVTLSSPAAQADGAALADPLSPHVRTLRVLLRGPAFSTYIWLDKFFDLHEMWADVLKRRFITVGFTGFVLLIPLALTSTRRLDSPPGGNVGKPCTA
jgi:sulfoxide reductase heme-binding subunit YedZ